MKLIPSISSFIPFSPQINIFFSPRAKLVLLLFNEIYIDFIEVILFFNSIKISLYLFSTLVALIIRTTIASPLEFVLTIICLSFPLCSFSSYTETFSLLRIFFNSLIISFPNLEFKIFSST